MLCNEYRYILHEYASGKLSELESHAVEKHLRSCGKCRREVIEIKELKAFLSHGFQKSIIPPVNLKSGIMSSINLKKYKKMNRNTLGELASWGRSLVSAGLILLLINMTPADKIVNVRNEWEIRSKNITQRIYKPLSSINEGLEKFTMRIAQLDGITGRIEREKEGGN